MCQVIAAFFFFTEKIEPKRPLFISWEKINRSTANLLNYICALRWGQIYRILNLEKKLFQFSLRNFEGNFRSVVNYVVSVSVCAIRRNDYANVLIQFFLKKSLYVSIYIQV